ncbi:MAG: DMT family transporter [Betaproteobacteria bacterium]
MISLLSLHTAVALFGFAGLFGKWIAWDPVAIVLGRTVVAAIVLGVWLQVRRTGRLHPSPGLALSGGILAVHWMAFFNAIAVANVTIALLGYASFPAFVLMLEHRRSGRVWSTIDLATAALVVAGLAMTVQDFNWGNTAAQGLAWGVVSGFTFAWLVVRTRGYTTGNEASSLAFWLNAFAALFILPIVLAQGGVTGTVDGRTLGMVIVLGVACTAIAHTLFIVGIAGTGSLTAAIVAALEPVYGIGLAWVLLGEVPTLRTALGASLLVTAAILATWRVRPAPIP